MPTTRSSSKPATIQIGDVVASLMARDGGSRRTRLVDGGPRGRGGPAWRPLAGGACVSRQERAFPGSLVAAARRLLEAQDLLLLSEQRDSDGDEESDDY